MSMRKSRFTEEHIAHALRQAETWTPVTEVCRSMGISEQSYYHWKKRELGTLLQEEKIGRTSVFCDPFEIVREYAADYFCRYGVRFTTSYSQRPEHRFGQRQREFPYGIPFCQCQCSHYSRLHDANG